MSDIGERIKRIRRQKEISQIDLANRINVKQPTIADWERGKCDPHRKRMQSIADALEVDVQMLERGILTNDGRVDPLSENGNNHQYSYIRTYDFSVSAGFGAMIEEDIGQGYLFKEPFDERWLRRITNTKADDLSLVFVDGDSMEPTLRSGDQVLVDHTQKGPKDAIYVLRLDGETYVKRLQFHRDRLLVISDNDKYRDREILSGDNTDCEIHGRVIWFARKA